MHVGLAPAAALAATLAVGAHARAERADPEAPDPKTGDHLIDRWHKTMGTVAHIAIWAEDDAKAAKAIQAAFDELDRIDAAMTVWTADSPVSRINAAAGDKKGVEVTDELIYVLERAADASRISNGAFDITVGSFWGVWKFDEDKDGTIPTREQVEEKRKLVGWKDVVIDKKGKTVRLKRKGQQITLGGIAKGYAVDRAVELLRQQGFVDFLVQAGGDMFVAGRKGDRRWRVGIRDPRAERDVFFAVAEVEDMTFSTSGDYERYVIEDGVRYHHILDPKTGYPAKLTRSVTVMAKDAITADGLSKGFFILGPEKGMALVEKLDDVEAVFVGSDNKVWISSGLEGKVTVLQQPTDGL
jgi:thiamine biosynthesis lipoprotein